MKQIHFDLTGEYIITLGCWIADENDRFTSPCYVATADYFKTVLDAKLEIEQCVYTLLSTEITIDSPKRIYVDYAIKGNETYEHFTGFGILFNTCFFFDETMNKLITKSKGLLLPEKQIQNIVNNGAQNVFLYVPKQPEFKNGESGEPIICDDLRTFTFKLHQYNNICDYDIEAPYAVGDILFLKEPWRFCRINENNKTVHICFEDIYHIKFIKCKHLNMKKLPQETSKKQSAMSMQRSMARYGIRVNNINLVRLNELDETVVNQIGNSVISDISAKYSNPYVFVYHFDKFRITD